MASEIFGRPVHSNPHSLLANCQHWLQECREHHQKCHRNASSRLPSRLLEIGEERITLKVLPKEPLVLGRFATLTWTEGATSDPLVPWSMENFPQMIQGMDLSHLPRLFQDAALVTRSLGIHHLWVDILCIDHGDPGDWFLEREKVSEYFANAEINIVAGAKDGQTGVLCPRLPPRFQPICLNGMKDVFIGWLGTDAYNDPHGLKVSQYPDAWKYESPAHIRKWAGQELALAHRNLVLQGDEDPPQDSDMTCTTLNSQLYMQCQEEIRWENGRRRPRTADSLADWYNLVEEYSGQGVSKNRTSFFSQMAHRFPHISEYRLGESLAGLWSSDLIRGLLWWTEKVYGYKLKAHEKVAPSWSWWAVPDSVKHFWPSDAKPLASVQGWAVNPRSQDFDGAQDFEESQDFDGYIVVRSLVMEIQWGGSPRLPDLVREIEVNVLDEDEPIATLRLGCIIDSQRAHFDIFVRGAGRRPRLYAIRMTRRIGLLLQESGQADGTMRRVGLFIVAKPDTQRWMAITGERDVKII